MKSPICKIGVILTVFCLNTDTSSADLLPKGERINAGTPGEKQCYNLEEYKKILQITISYNNCVAANEVKDLTIVNLREQVVSLGASLALKESTVKALHDENKWLLSKWTAENKKRHEAENKPQWGTWVAWGVAAAATVAAGTAITIAITK